METILFLAHSEPSGVLSKTALEALQSAEALAGALPGSTLVAGLTGAGVQAAADSIAGCQAARILGIDGEEFGQARYSTDAAAAEALCRAAGATIVIAAGTSRFARALPGVAYRLGGRVETHVTGLCPDRGAISANRWYYRQRMEAILTREHRPWVILLDPGCQPAWQGPSGQAAVEAVAVDLPPIRTKPCGIRAPQSGQQTIRPDAPVLFVAGAGWTKNQADGKPHPDEASELILGFLNRSQASLGSSKSLVDQSGEGQAVLPFLTHMNQVGQTGSTPRHPKGLATCCHGEEPHVVGWRFITERRAVNLDANCGWARGKADVLYVADAFAVVRRINELLEQKS